MGGEIGATRVKDLSPGTLDRETADSGLGNPRGVTAQDDDR